MSKVIQSKAIEKLVRETILRLPSYGAVRLEAEEADIHRMQMRGEDWGRVPIIATPESARLFKLYEALAEIEGVLQDEQGLDTLLFVGDPEHATSDDALLATP